MSYRYDVSYPFMDVARRHGISYGDVLEAAQFHIDDEAGRTPRIAFLDEEKVPLHAMEDIVDLLHVPVAERGGRTEVCDVCGVAFDYLTTVPACKGPPDNGCPVAR